MINPAGYTTTSIAILDALLAVGLPVIECHITNIHARESFRHDSYVSKAAKAVIAGFGIDGYALAITGLAASSAPEARNKKRESNAEPERAMAKPPKSRLSTAS